MTDDRRLAFAAGALYLVTFISSIPAVFLLDPVLNNPDYIISAGEDTRVSLGATLDLVNALACIGTAVALYPVVKRQNGAPAMGFVTSRMFEAAVIVIGVVSILAVVTLRQAGTEAGDPATLITVGQALVAVRDWTFVIGPGLMPGINAALLGYLLYRSALVPRVIPILGLIGAPLLISSAIGIILGINDPVSAWSAIATLPIFLWELSLGIWLLVKGFRPEGLHALHEGIR